MTRMRRERGGRAARRRGSVVVIVLWALAIAALIASSVQLFSYRQATVGRETLHRIQARWAARAGLENTIAMLALHTEQPIPNDAFAMINDLEYVSTYALYDASYDIQYHRDGRNLAGPLDEHSRMNINGFNGLSLGLLEDMTPDVISAVKDWMDPDSDPGMLGAEDDHYLAQNPPYRPRNGPLRHASELELVAGIWGDFVRGEDWNMDNRMDPNENDGARSLPDDEPDGVLDMGWAGRITVNSVDGGATASGLPRIHLRWADPAELAERLGVDDRQAQLLIAFGKVDENTLEQLITTPLTSINARGQIAGENANPDVTPLSDEQLKAVLAETSMLPAYDRRPGKINLNTASPDLIRDVLALVGVEEAIADEIIYIRDSRPEGIVSILDLREISDLDPAMIQRLAQYFTTWSNVFTVSCRGRSEVSDAEVEIIAVVDRSSLPVRILEYREQ